MPDDFECGIGSPPFDAYGTIDHDHLTSPTYIADAVLLFHSRSLIILLVGFAWSSVFVQYVY
jgi:hypothetical protein